MGRYMGADTRVVDAGASVRKTTTTFKCARPARGRDSFGVFEFGGPGNMFSHG